MVVLLVAVAYSTFIALGMYGSLLGAAWPVMHADFSASLSGASLISFIITASTITATVLGDRLRKRFGTHRVATAAVLMMAAAVAGFSFSRSYLALCLLAVPFGFGAGSIDAGMNSYVALHGSVRQMAFLHCFWGVGSMTGPLILSRCLVAGLGWRGGYRVVAGIEFVIFAAVLLSKKLWQGEEEETVESAPSKGVFEAMKLPGAFTACLSFFCYSGVEGTCGLWAASYLTFRSVSPERASALASAYYIGITIGRFVSGIAAGRIGRKTFIRIGVTLAAASVIGLCLTKNPVLASAFILLNGIGCAPVYPNLMGLTPERFGRGNCSSLVGVQMSSGYLGSLLLPPLFGILAEKAGLGLYPFYLLIFQAGLFVFCRIGLFSRKKA